MKPRDHAAPSPLMTVNELARYLKVSHRTFTDCSAAATVRFSRLATVSILTGMKSTDG